MFHLVIIASQRPPSSTLIRVLEQEGITYNVVNDPRLLNAGPELAHAVILDGSACVMEEVAITAKRCRELGQAFLCGITSAQLAAYEVSWGASDFFITPPLVGEITARIRNLVDREGKGSEERKIQVGKLVINLERYEVSSGGSRVLLTFKEYQLLCLLASNPGRVYSREALLSEIWGYDFFGGTRTVDVHIRRLRSKIEDGKAGYIETVWNVGYRFRTEEMPSAGEGLGHSLA